MASHDFAELAPHIDIADGRTLTAGASGDDAREALARSAAVLLRRGLRKDAVEVALEIKGGEPADDVFSSIARSRVAGEMLAAAKHPSSRTIQLCFEMAYRPSWLRYATFHPPMAPETGVEASICNTDAVSRQPDDVMWPSAGLGMTCRRTPLPA